MNRSAGASARLHLARSSRADVPDDDGWLTKAERDLLETLHVPKRRSDWRMGRWTAKKALRRQLSAAGRRVQPEDIQVMPGPGGAPVVTVRGRQGHRVPVVTISHSHGCAFAVAAPARVAVGCDLEWVEARSGRFVADYLTCEERTWVRAAPDEARALAVNLCWSAKESALKALGEGLRMDTRTVVVEAPQAAVSFHDGWRPLSVRAPGGLRLEGWWRANDGFVWTVVADAPGVLACPVEVPTAT